MSDDVETLRSFIRQPENFDDDALAALDRLVAERDSLRTALNNRYDADQRAARAIFAETKRTSGFPGVREVVAYYVTEVARLESNLAHAHEVHIAQLAVHAALQLKYAMLLEQSEDQR